jgi:uncharacterized protein YndB with AHSA1/START domain
MMRSHEDPDMPAFVQPQPLQITRTLHARRETVFSAWGSADHVSQWFAPLPYTVPAATVDLRVGGRFDVCMRSPEGVEHWTRGTFVELIPDSRLVINAHVIDAAGRKLFRAYTEVDFSDAFSGTRIDVTQTYVVFDPDVAAPMIGGAQAGWNSALDQLQECVMRMSGAIGIEVRSVVHATFHLERSYNSPVARVWKALTDDAAKQKWFGGGPGALDVLEREMDVRPGGRERLKGRWPNGVVSDFDAIYHDVIPNERLVYSYIMHIDDKKISASLATVQLKAEGERTRLSITEQGAFLDGYDDAGSREHGTGKLLDLLGASLEG